MSVCRTILLAFILLGLFLTSLFAAPARAQSPYSFASEFPHAPAYTPSDEEVNAFANFARRLTLERPDGQFVVDKERPIGFDKRCEESYAHGLEHYSSVLGELTDDEKQRLRQFNVECVKYEFERDEWMSSQCPTVCILDLAQIIRFRDEQTIGQTADWLQDYTGIPIVVITDGPLPDHLPSPEHATERFLNLVGNEYRKADHPGYDQWYYAIVFFVSPEDRQARIELGSAWRSNKDQLVQTILNDVVLPHFQRGDFSSGIAAGVKQLEEDFHPLTERLPGLPPPPSDIRTGIIRLSILLAMIVFTLVTAYFYLEPCWCSLLWFVVLIILYRTPLLSYSGLFTTGAGATITW